MEILQYPLQVGAVSQKYNKIKNCKVVKPPYEEDGYYSDKFFFDKRLGLSNSFNDNNKTFYDKVTIKGKDYYYYFQGNQSYVATFSGNYTGLTTVAGPFNINSNSPKKLALGKGIVGPVNATATIANFIGDGGTGVVVGQGGNIDFTLIPGYAGGYVAFNYTGTTGVSVGDYIVFSNGQLKGGINRVEYIDGNNNIYIIGTNIRGTIPKVGEAFNVYKANNTSPGNTIIVGHNTGITACILHGGNSVSNQIQTLTMSEQVIDIVSFNNNIFALTENWLHYSNAVQYSNMQMYALDRFEIDGGVSLFSMGKAMLVFSKQNKLISAANGTSQNIGYVAYDLNYNGEPFSKYSMIFTDQSIYIVQKDRQLKEVSIQQNNTSTFDIITKEVLQLNRGLFNGLSGGELILTANDRFINFLYLKDGKTINYQYDKMYQHIIEQEYNYEIYNTFGSEYLAKNFIFNESGYLDNGVTYNQEINFSIDTGMYFYMPYILRTIFGLVDNLFNVNLDYNYEIGATISYGRRELKSFEFDNRLSGTLTGDELIGGDTIPVEESVYNGTIASIQSRILETGRFFNFNYNSFDRFMIGDSYILARKSKPFINEPLFTN